MRWLSRGNAARRLFELRVERLQFFREKNHDFQADLEIKGFVTRLAYLTDIFEVLNNFNLSFQGSKQTVTESISKLEAFVHKLDLWVENIKNKTYGMYKFLASVEDKPSDELSNEIVRHLSHLKAELMRHFPDVASCA